MPQIPTGGIKDRNVSRLARLLTSKFADGRSFFGPVTAAFPLGQRNVGPQSSIIYDAGLKAMAMLRLAANVAAGETITIGPIDPGNGVAVTDVFTVEAITTNTGVTEVGAIDNTTDPVLLTLSGAPGVVVSAGDMLRSTNEICKVLRVISLTQYVIARARGGTAIAAHANGDSWFQAAVPTAGISLPFNATFTPAVAGPCIAAEINNAATTSGERASARSSRVFPKLSAASLAAGAEVILFTKNPGVLTTALAETLAGANNAWDTAALRAGQEPGFRKSFRSTRVPNAQEVAVGFISIPLDFTPTWLQIKVIATATGIDVGWNGGILYDSTTGILRIDNTGATDWATTSTLYIEATA